MHIYIYIYIYSYRRLARAPLPPFKGLANNRFNNLHLKRNRVKHRKTFKLATG